MGKIIVRGLIAGVVILIFMMIPGMLCNLIFPGHQESYENTALFRTMDDWRSFLFFLYPMVIGVGFSWLWSKVKPSFQPGQSTMARAFSFGILYFVVACIPGCWLHTPASR